MGLALLSGWPAVVAPFDPNKGYVDTLPTKALSASLTQTQTLLSIYKEHAIGSKVALTSLRNLPHGVLFRGGSEAEHGPIS